MQGALTRQLEHYKASAGTAILMDVKTGDIKAIANVSKTATGYREVLNNAIGDAAEPGSVIKADDGGFVGRRVCSSGGHH